jgi:thymidylate synthase (FAD)
MLDNGVPKEDARMVLPLATMTNLIMTANFREWRHIIGLRTSSAAQWEIRELANKALDILIKQASNVFSDLSQGKE